MACLQTILRGETLIIGSSPLHCFNPTLKSLPTYLLSHQATILWGHLKNVCMSKAAASLCEIPGIFEHVHQSLHQHFQTSITTGSHNFKQLLQTLHLSTTLPIKTLSFLSSAISPVCASSCLCPFILTQIDDCYNFLYLTL